MSGASFTVLVLEDNDDEVARLTRNFKEYEAGTGVKFKLVRALHVAGARTLLDEQHIDCAILDLKVPTAAGETAAVPTGSDFAGFVLAAFPLPVVINSGLPQELPQEVRKFPVKVIDKEGGRHKEIFDWLLDLAPLMTALRESIQRIRAEVAHVFSGSIWKHWADTKARAFSPPDLAHVITRQVVAYVYEQLSLPLDGSPNYSPHEFYYRPALRERLHTGDLITRDNKTFVVLSPQCDMVWSYPDNILVAACEPLGEKWPKLKANLAGEGKVKRGAEESLRNYATQNISISQHFLPPCGDSGPWLISFKQLSTFSSGEVDALKGLRFASISAQFVPHLVQRFSAHLGRIGQPTLDEGALCAV